MAGYMWAAYGGRTCGWLAGWPAGAPCRPICIPPLLPDACCCVFCHFCRSLVLQGNWADGQGKEVYIRNYYSTKAFFDKLPGQQQAVPAGARRAALL